MRISVDQEKCIGCGACVSIADDLFEMNDEGLSNTIVNEVSEDQIELANEAIESCPTSAILGE